MLSERIERLVLIISRLVLIRSLLFILTSRFMATFTPQCGTSFGGVQAAEAVKLFEYMNESGGTPDRRSFELMITAHVINRDIQSASAVLTAMVSVV